MDGVKSAAEKLVDLKRYVNIGTLLAIDVNSLKNIQTKLDWGLDERLPLSQLWGHILKKELTCVELRRSSCRKCNEMFTDDTKLNPG